MIKINYLCRSLVKVNNKSSKEEVQSSVETVLDLISKFKWAPVEIRVLSRNLEKYWTDRLLSVGIEREEAENKLLVILRKLHECLGSHAFFSGEIIDIDKEDMIALTKEARELLDHCLAQKVYHLETDDRVSELLCKILAISWSIDRQLLDKKFWEYDRDFTEKDLIEFFEKSEKVLQNAEKVLHSRPQLGRSFAFAAKPEEKKQRLVLAEAGRLFVSEVEGGHNLEDSVSEFLTIIQEVRGTL